MSDADNGALGTLSRFRQLENLVQALCASQMHPNLPADLIQMLADDEIERRDTELVTVYSNVACPSTGEILSALSKKPSHNATQAKLSIGVIFSDPDACVASTDLPEA